MNCIVCGGKTSVCLDLSSQPLANNLVDSSEESAKLFQLGLEYCLDCSHGQLTKFVDPRLLFTNYLYASGTSNTLDTYFSNFAQALKKAHPSGGPLLDVASNDGSFIWHTNKHGFESVGIDPAKNLAKAANEAGLKTICDFFPSSQLTQKFDVITAMNVFAHNPDPVKFLIGIKDSLSEGGIAYIQTSQAQMLNSGEFDTIYHEHFSFFTVASMRVAAKIAGLELIDYQLVDIHGNSYLFHVGFPGAESKKLELPAPVPIQPVLLETNDHADQVYKEFSRKSEQTILDLQEVVSSHKERGYDIVVAGVAAKALTVVHASDIHVDYFIDEAPLKIGKYIPKIGVEIKSFSALPEGQKYLVVIGAWNFEKEIRAKLEKTYPQTSMKFLTYFPTLTVL